MQRAFVIATLIASACGVDTVVLRPGAPECSGGVVSEHVMYKNEPVWTFNGTAATEVLCNVTIPHKVAYSDEFTIQSVFYIRGFATRFQNFSPFNDNKYSLKEEQTPGDTRLTVRRGVHMTCPPSVKIEPSNRWFVTRTSCRTINAGAELRCTHWINGILSCTQDIVLPVPTALPADPSAPLSIGSDRTGGLEFMIGEVHSVSFKAEYDDSPFESTETRVPTRAPTPPTLSPTLSPPTPSPTTISTTKTTTGTPPTPSTSDSDLLSSLLIPCLAGGGGLVLAMVAFVSRRKKHNPGVEESKWKDGYVDNSSVGSQSYRSTPSMASTEKKDAEGKISPAFAFHSKLGLFPQFRPVSHTVQPDLSNEV